MRLMKVNSEAVLYFSAVRIFRKSGLGFFRKEVLMNRMTIRCAWNDSNSQTFEFFVW